MNQQEAMFSYVQVKTLLANSAIYLYLGLPTIGLLGLLLWFILQGIRNKERKKIDC
jgi:hypothetical protein